MSGNLAKLMAMRKKANAASGGNRRQAKEKATRRINAVAGYNREYEGDGNGAGDEDDSDAEAVVATDPDPDATDTGSDVEDGEAPAEKKKKTVAQKSGDKRKVETATTDSPSAAKKAKKSTTGEETSSAHSKKDAKAVDPDAALDEICDKAISDVNKKASKKAAEAVAAAAAAKPKRSAAAQKRADEKEKKQLVELAKIRKAEHEKIDFYPRDRDDGFRNVEIHPAAVLKFELSEFLAVKGQKAKADLAKACEVTVFSSPGYDSLWVSASDLLEAIQASVYSAIEAETIWMNDAVDLQRYPCEYRLVFCADNGSSICRWNWVKVIRDTVAVKFVRDHGKTMRKEHEIAMALLYAFTVLRHAATGRDPVSRKVPHYVQPLELINVAHIKENITRSVAIPKDPSKIPYKEYHTLAIEDGRLRRKPAASVAALLSDTSTAVAASAVKENGGEAKETEDEAGDDAQTEEKGDGPDADAAAVEPAGAVAPSAEPESQAQEPETQAAADGTGEPQPDQAALDAADEAM